MVTTLFSNLNDYNFDTGCKLKEKSCPTNSSYIYGCGINRHCNNITRATFCSSKTSFSLFLGCGCIGALVVSIAFGIGVLLYDVFKLVKGYYRVELVMVNNDEEIEIDSDIVNID
jgi:hypothetical protein